MWPSELSLVSPETPHVPSCVPNTMQLGGPQSSLCTTHCCLSYLPQTGPQHSLCSDMVASCMLLGGCDPGVTDAAGFGPASCCCKGDCCIAGGCPAHVWIRAPAVIIIIICCCCCMSAWPGDATLSGAPLLLLGCGCCRLLWSDPEAVSAEARGISGCIRFPRELEDPTLMSWAYAAATEGCRPLLVKDIPGGRRTCPALRTVMPPCALRPSAGA
jgi:hypothetical protein